MDGLSTHRHTRRHTNVLMLAVAAAVALGSGRTTARAGVITTGDTSAVLQYTSTTWQVQDPSAVTLYVGLNSTGTLNITGIATLTTPVPVGLNYPSLSIGSAATANGGVGVYGPDASLIAPGLIEVGEFGTGTLLVTDGASAGSTEFAAGGQAGSTGYVNVDGVNSTIRVSDNFLIGNQGNGTLDVDDGGAVKVAYGVIGGTGTGNATFSNGSLFACTQSLIIAGANFGNVTLESNSTLTAPTIVLGAEPTPSESINNPGGHLMVDGSTVVASAALEIAYDYYSRDIVSVKNGGSISAGEIDVGDGGTGSLVVGGDFSGRYGTADTSGLISKITASTINIGGGQFDVGGIQSAMFVINGSVVTSDSATIGGVDGFGSVSGITASGARSTWNAGNLTVATGDLGGGLSVSSGGLVTSADTLIDDGIAVAYGSFDGTPSTWTVTGTLYVGSATGPQPYTLEVTDGALLETKDAFFGDEDFSSGSGATLIDGDGTTWTAGNVTVGNGFDHVLTISGGAMVSTQQFTIANNSTGEVVLTDSGSSLTTNKQLLVVGVNQSGMLTIQNGATLTTGDAYIGSLEGALGTVLLTDASSSWTAGTLTVGDQGTGNLTIQNGAALQTGDAYLGSFQGGLGTVTLTDPDSSWSVSTLTVGDLGTGNLSILNGATLTATSLHIGSNAMTQTGGIVQGMGTVVVDATETAASAIRPADTDDEAMLTVTGDLFVGESGVGELDILNGAVVTSNTGFVGTNGGGQGTLVIRGDGSQWIDANYLTIGTYGTGNATVSDGGSVTAGNILVGENAGGVGMLTVDAGTVMTPTSLDVGKGGNGTLIVKNGGTVNADTLTVGGLASGAGTVTFDGTGSTATLTTGVTVGEAGMGSLVLSNLSSVSTPMLMIGAAEGSNGTVSVSDFAPAVPPSSSEMQTTLAVAGLITVGSAGTGELTIENGGLVTSASGLVGDAGGTGSVTITGNPSLWAITGPLTIGGGGMGNLTISNGGLMTVAGLTTIGETGSGTVTVGNGNATLASVMIADAANSTGVLTVGDGTSLPLVIASGTLTVGNQGAGNVTIQSGDLTVNALTLGASAGGSGVVNVNGAGGVNAELQVAGKLLVGSAGAGDVEVTAGGHVIAQSVVVGGGAGAAQYNMNGNGCTLAVIGSITIGTAGATGTFSEMNGGNVSAQTTNVGTSSLTAIGVGVGTLTVSTGTFKAGKLTVASGSTVMIQQGGTLSGSSATIGSGHFLSAQVTITGPTSKLDVGSGNISVGGLGAADLEVDGGVIDCGTLTVDVAGKLQGDGGTINGTLVNKGGTVHPGDSPGTLTLSGDYSQTDGVLDVEFAGTAAGLRDLLSVAGNATLTGGEIQFTFTDGYVPAAGDVLPFLSATSVPTVSGVTFDFVGAPAGVSFSVVTAGDSEELVVAPATPEPGTALLVGMGLAGMMVRRRRTK